MQKKRTVSQLFERPEAGERTLGVHVNWKTRDRQYSKAREYREEFLDLIAAAQIELTEVVTTTRYAPDPKYFIGKGKTETLKHQVAEEQIDLVIFNHDLSPLQERNLEQVLQCRVLDRTGLILDIFAQRARSFEGQLQVELAQLEHLSTRLVRGWTHLERQRGGIGLRGPGETQLETDRRLIQTRIKSIKKQLNEVRKQRAQNRRARQRAEIPTVSLVGYTNAGKSTLFNKMTLSHVKTEDQLFATLDPTVRRIKLPIIGTTLLTDTVGFIRHLPHQLIQAFRATLEETQQAQLLLHVVDVSNPDHAAQMEQVHNVLEEIGVDRIPRLVVCNKIDQFSSPKQPCIDYNAQGKPWRVWISAKTGEGLDLLHRALKILLVAPLVHCCLRLPAQAGQIRSQLYDLDAVISEKVNSIGDYCLEVKLQSKDFDRLIGQSMKSAVT